MGFPTDEEVLLWAKRMFPGAVRLEEAGGVEAPVQVPGGVEGDPGCDEALPHRCREHGSGEQGGAVEGRQELAGVMKIRLLRYTGSKIDAIKCVRNAVESLNLQMAKNLCEMLPFEIEVKPERVEELRRCFEMQDSDGSDTAALFNAWNGQTRDWQVQLLQYLVGMGMLQVEKKHA